METVYSITVQEVLQRPIIRNDRPEEWMNKMTDDELHQYDSETRQICIENGVLNIFPDINAACLGKNIDRSIIYEILKEQKIKF